MKRLFGSVIFCLGLAGCVTSPSMYFSQPGVPEDRYRADFDACVAAGESAASNVKTYSANSSPSLAGAAAVGITKGIVEGVQRQHAAHEAAEACMTKRGYTKVSMSDEQRERFGRLSPEDQKKADARLAAGSF